MSPIRVVELYAGAGGLSCGLEAAGANVVLAVEANAMTAKTYAANHPHVKLLTEKISGKWNVTDRLNKHVGDVACEVLAGGPPCQGWSTLGARGGRTDKGRRRLARLNACVDHFLDQVERLRPPAVLMENVLGLAVREGGAHLKAVEARLRSLGYRVYSKVLRAADYGVPQLRKRLFVVAIRQTLDFEYAFPAPTHTEKDWVTVWSAIGDLPSLESGGLAEKYDGPARTTLQRSLRNGEKKLTWHQAPEHSDRTVKILKALDGDGASRAEIEKKLKLRSGFHNTYCRLRADAPAPAVTSSAGRVSSGRNAHPVDDRALTPREAARLQTFPDAYTWEGDRWPIYTQIGNAVPPALAAAVAGPLVAGLQRALRGADPRRGRGDARRALRKGAVRRGKKPGVGKTPGV